MSSASYMKKKPQTSHFSDVIFAELLNVFSLNLAKILRMLTCIIRQKTRKIEAPGEMWRKIINFIPIFCN